MYWQSYNSILRSLSLSSQGNTKQQTTLSIAFLSLASDLYTNICKRGVPTQQMHSHGAAGRSTCGRGSHDVSLCPSGQPSNMSFPTLSRHGLTVPCSRGTLLSILPYPLALLLTMCSPLGRNRWQLCIRNTGLLPRCTEGPWVQLSSGCSDTKGLSLIHPLPCTTPRCRWC